MLNAEKIKRDIIVIGAAAGGVTALYHLFTGLPATLHAAIAVVQHRSAIFNRNLRRVFIAWTRLPVVEPCDGEPFKRGTIYLAPADHHLLVEQDVLRVTRGPKEHHARPAIDPLFRSAGHTYGRRVVGVVLSGSGHDGLAGLSVITQAGGLTLIQSPDEAIMPSMPKNARLGVHIDMALTIRQLPAVLDVLARGQTIPTSNG
jgi:two-component system chemotaxis response regulator CheB